MGTADTGPWLAVGRTTTSWYPYPSLDRHPALLGAARTRTNSSQTSLVFSPARFEIVTTHLALIDQRHVLGKIFGGLRELHALALGATARNIGPNIPAPKVHGDDVIERSLPNFQTDLAVVATVLDGLDPFQIVSRDGADHTCLLCSSVVTACKPHQAPILRRLSHHATPLRYWRSSGLWAVAHPESMWW